MELDRITAIVVDDEVNPRKLLQLLLDWSALGIEFIGEAANGNEALDLIDSLRPNIVFTDINMPYMDGLELARLIKEKDPLIKVVILTAYPEFEYAKQSVSIGVHDFLVKPIQADVLKKLMVDLINTLKKEKAHWNEFRKIKLELQENKAELREKYLLALLMGNSSPELLNRRYSYFFDDAFHSYCCVAVLDIYADHISEEEENFILRMSCKRLVELLVKDRKQIDVFHDDGGRIVLLSWDQAMELEYIGEQAIRIIKDKMNCNPTLGVGRGYDRLDRVKISYKEALDALRYGKIYGGGQVISFTADIRLVDSQIDLRLTEVEEIIFFIKSGIKEQATHSIEQLFLSLVDNRGGTMEEGYLLGAHFLSLFFQTMSELGINQLRTDLLNGEMYKQMFKCQTLSELRLLLCKLAEETAEQIKGTRSSKKTRIIDEVLDFLAEAYRNPDISLSSVSELFHLNSSYLSRIFKQEVRQNFTDYLLKLRIDEAAKLMNETDLKAYQIAEKVGIKDPYYFSHLFKKATGISIQEYKKGTLKEINN